MEELNKTLHNLIDLTDEVYEVSVYNKVNTAMEKAVFVVQGANDLIPILMQHRIKISSYFMEDLQDIVRAIQENDIFLLMDRMKFALRLDLEKIIKQIGEVS